MQNISSRGKKPISIAKEERIFLRVIYRRATLKRMRQKRRDLAKILSRIRKLRGARKNKRAKERGTKASVSRLQDKEDDKDRRWCVQTRLIIFVGRRATYDVYVSPRRDAPVRLIAAGTPKTNYPAVLLPFSRQIPSFLAPPFSFLALTWRNSFKLSKVRCSGN